MRIPLAEVLIVAVLILTGWAFVPDRAPSRHFIDFTEIDAVRRARHPVLGEAPPRTRSDAARLELFHQFQRSLTQSLCRLLEWPAKPSASTADIAIARP